MTPPVFAHGHLRLYLLALLNEQPRHGYELIQALTDRFDGTYAPSAGTIYPRLAKLETEGLVTKTSEGRKTIYRITDEGRQEVENRADELDEIEKDVDSSVQRLAQELRRDLSAARDRLRDEFSSFRERATDDDGPTWSSDFGRKATEFAQRASAAATAGWSAGDAQHKAGGDFGAAASAAFHAASGTFSGDTDESGDDATRASATEPPVDGDATAPDDGSAPRSHDAPPTPPAADISIPQRADLSLDRFRQDIRQDLRRAEAEGRVTDDVLHLIDAELGRVRDLLRHVLEPRD